MERSTWCAGTRTRPRRRGLKLSRRREIKYDSLLNRHNINTFKTDSGSLDVKYSKWLVSLQEVYVHILDMSETKKVWEFAEAFKRKYKALNVLVSDTSYLFSYLQIYANVLCWQLLHSYSFPMFWISISQKNDCLTCCNLCRSITQAPS